jgi:hypothetical protein
MLLLLIVTTSWLIERLTGQLDLGQPALSTGETALSLLEMTNVPMSTYIWVIQLFRFPGRRPRSKSKNGEE